MALDSTLDLCPRHGPVKARVYLDERCCDGRGECPCGGYADVRARQCPECGEECRHVTDPDARAVVDHLRERCKLHPNEVAALWAVLGSRSEGEEPAPGADERALNLLEHVGDRTCESARDAVIEWVRREREDGDVDRRPLRSVEIRDAQQRGLLPWDDEP